MIWSGSSRQGRRASGVAATGRRSRPTARARSTTASSGVSGGCDSSYLVHLMVELGVRPLAVHFDNTWNSPTATSNIYSGAGQARTSRWRPTWSITASTTISTEPSCSLALRTWRHRRISASWACSTGRRRSTASSTSSRVTRFVPRVSGHLGGCTWTVGTSGASMSATAPSRCGPTRTWSSVSSSAGPPWRDRTASAALPHRLRQGGRQAIPRRALTTGNGTGGTTSRTGSLPSTTPILLPTRFGIDFRQIEFSALVRSGQLDRDAGDRGSGAPREPDPELLSDGQEASRLRRR